MAYKAPIQQFQTSWQKTVSWAKSQGIPQNAWYPVYQLDSKRLLSGSFPMAEAERTRAILAAANPNNVTPLPTDNPSPGSGLGAIGHFFSNVVHDASNIFTGLQPTKLIPSIVDGFVNTVEHPNWVLDPKKNTIAQWVPGVAVVGELEQGGLSNVMSHPLISFLDVLPLADTGVGVLAKAGLGAGIAERAGIPESLLGHSRLLGQDAQNGVGALTLARKLTGSITTPGAPEGFYRGAGGLPAWGKLTISQRMKNYSNTHMMGSDQAKLAASMTKITAAESHQLAVSSKAWNDSYVKLNDEQKAQVWDIWTGIDRVLGGRDRSALIDDNTLDVPVKEFFQQTFAMTDTLQEKLLAAEEGAMVRMPNGTDEWRAAKGVDLKVVTARDTLAKTEADVEEASARSDNLADNITANDNVAKPAFEMLRKLTNQVNQSKGTGLSMPGVSLAQPGTTSEALRTWSVRAEYSHLRDNLEKSRSTRHQSPHNEARFVADTQRLRDWVHKHAEVKASVDVPTIAKLLGRETVNGTQMRLINEIFGVGGLIDQVMDAYDAKDFNAMRVAAKELDKKFKNPSISGDLKAPDPLNTGLAVPVRVSPLLATSRQLAENLYKYAKARERDEKELRDSIHKNGLHAKIAAHAKASAHFEKVYRDNPAGNWQPLMIRLQEENLAASAEGKVAVAQAVAHYKDLGLVKEEAEKEFQSDPANLISLIMAHIKASSTSVFAGMLSPGEINRAMEGAKNAVEALRARGFTPHWVPNVTSAESKRFGESDYTVRIQPLTHMGVDAASSKMLDMRNTVSDMHAGFTKGMWEQAARDANIEFIDNMVIPGHAYKQSDLEALAVKMNPDLRKLANYEAVLARTFESEWGLVKFDPDAKFGVSSKHIKGGDSLWMPKEMVSGLEKIVEKMQIDPSGGLAAATRVFRTAVLGYSPRFIAHIGLGGTFLLVLRHPLAFRFLPDALRMMKDSDFRAKIHTTSTQVGADRPESMGSIAFHEATGKRFIWDWGHHLMEKLNLPPDKMSSWLKVIPQMTFKLTNVMTDMQRTLVYLDGAAKAEGRKFYFDEVTGERFDMTDARAQEEGMRAANRTMGNLTQMSPFERTWMTTIMPFYGWTRHVLTYVAEYPVDHPYRAMFLANLANMNSSEVDKALYTRIQNLFFLGQPDANGNVSAIDVRALNPLRDVANYATLGGLISALNPAVSAPFAMVDPQIVFGSNLLYPAVTYNDLYGTTQAAPGGSALTAIEQFVPEATTVDAALGLSAQYRGLQRSSPAAFTKLIYGSLNIPFLQVQGINLKQIAAQQEMKRYQVAKAAAQSAFQSGDFGAIAGLSSVPNPLQDLYNVSPADLEALYSQTLARTGLPPSEVLPSLPAPHGL